MLLTTLVGRELFDDDTPISPTFDIQWKTWVHPFGTQPKITHADGEGAMGFHIDPIIDDLAEGMDLLRGGSFGVDREATAALEEAANEAFGDILPVRKVMPSLPGMITNPLVHLMGMENYYLSMYDYPDELHEVMDMATTVYEKYYDFLENEGLLLPTNGISPINQESFAFTSELPTENVTKTTQCWGFLESQETTAVSPDVFGEFVFPYQDRMAKRFGLLSYGCCERVDAIWPDYLSKWKNLRKLSVSPFNNERQIGEYLRGTNVVYYSKPRAEYVTNHGPLDEEALRAYFKGVCEAASGCLFEMAQREVGTIFGDFERGRRYVQIFDVTLSLLCGLPSGICTMAETCGEGLAVEHNGDVYPCDHFVTPEHLLGNIREHSLAELFDGEKRQRFALAKRNGLDPSCLACEFFSLCHGGCPGHRENGKNALCAGLQMFFRHSMPAMKRMKELLSQNRAPAEIMDEL